MLSANGAVYNKLLHLSSLFIELQIVIQYYKVGELIATAYNSAVFRV